MPSDNPDYVIRCNQPASHGLSRITASFHYFQTRQQNPWAVGKAYQSKTGSAHRVMDVKSITLSAGCGPDTEPGSASFILFRMLYHAVRRSKIQPFYPASLHKDKIRSFEYYDTLRR